MNAYTEHWVRSVKQECLSKVVLFGERSSRRAFSQYVERFHTELNYQGKGNVLLFPRDTDVYRKGAVQCRERLGGLLRYYHVRGRPIAPGLPSFLKKYEAAKAPVTLSKAFGLRSASRLRPRYYRPMGWTFSVICRASIRYSRLRALLMAQMRTNSLDQSQLAFLVLDLLHQVTIFMR